MRDVVIRNYYRVYYIWDRKNNQYLHKDGVWRRGTGYSDGNSKGLFESFDGAIIMASLWGCNITEARQAPQRHEMVDDSFFNNLFQVG